jgi:hypothetical protein
VYVATDASEAEPQQLRQHVESTSPLVDSITDRVPVEARLVDT